MSDVTIVAKVITNSTAALIPAAVDTFVLTPRNGHIPRKRAKTKLLTKMALTRMTSRSAMHPTL
jgi:hypothetical protein